MTLDFQIYWCLTGRTEISSIYILINHQTLFVNLFIFAVKGNLNKKKEEAGN